MKRFLFLVAALALPACHKPLVRIPSGKPPAVLIQDVSVLDVESGTRTAHQDVLVSGGKIAAIRATGEPVPAGAKILAGAGATLLPGLIDSHAHVYNSTKPPWKPSMPAERANLESFLYCGVTTIFDPADVDNKTFKRRDEIARGEKVGPRMFAAGPAFTAPGGHPAAMMNALLPLPIRNYAIHHMTRQVSGEKDARAAVRELVKRKPDFIKIIVDSIPPEAPRIGNDALLAVCFEAKACGVRTVAHIGTTQDALDSGRAGVSAWMHGVYRERIPDDQIQALAAFKIPMVPTIVVFDSYSLLGQEPRVATRLERETQPAKLLASFDDPPAGNKVVQAFQPFLATVRSQRASARDNVRRLRAAGVTILAGSDSQPSVFPGPSLHRELKLLTEAGLTNVEAIRAATIDPAKFLANTPDPGFGIVKTGARADLLLVDGDPTEDLEALSAIRAVLKEGVILERLPVR